MKENDFEEFLRRHREELDVEEPDLPFIWQGVRQQMGKERSRYPRWVAAASIVLLLGSGMFYYLQPVPMEKAVLTSTEMLLEKYELRDEQRATLQQVREKEAELELNKADQQAYRDIFVELKLLEELHEEFKKDLPELEEGGRILNLLMKYYERKLRILERLSSEIERKEQEKLREEESFI